ncbi:hypothetical protein Dda_9172 [Drechslerella dactyloides]|uniref:Uncharacterized protein n=1 Tax=Drechslerella dactyloides TaxID=74499 RepID=A0AAD6IR88_DREDA|nr:hypothetical protein Dda_9172 [Drechslerella dactyloides]
MQMHREDAEMLGTYMQDGYFCLSAALLPPSDHITVQGLSHELSEESQMSPGRLLRAGYERGGWGTASVEGHGPSTAAKQNRR